MTVRFLYLVVLVTFQAIISCNSIPTGIRKREIETNRPIIGVMAQAAYSKRYKKFGRSYIAASYIKYLESSGARVVPIMNDLTEEEIEKLFHSINGVLFPGGGVNLTSSGYAKTGRIIYNLAKKSFDEGDYFPLWGTCLGFEYFPVLVSDTIDILSRTDSENLLLPLKFSQDYEKSKIFRDIPTDLAKFLSDTPTTLNAHNWSVTVKSFEGSGKMKEFFNVLSTNYDRNGIEFVSTMEAKNYPFYATQWHPEKNSFEWSLRENIPHEPMSIKVTQYMSNFFVNEARYSKHKFETIEQEQAALIYNYSPVYTGNISNFEQCYIFKPSSVSFAVKIK